MLKTKPSVLLVLGAIALGVGLAHRSQAEPQIPEPLRPWATWVLDSKEGKSARCPSHAGEDAPVCAWAARLALGLADRSGNFTQEWMMYSPGFVNLPGDKDHWPRDIKVDGRREPTVDHDGVPQVFLRLGRHAVTGDFQWDSLPESLMVPSETGLVALSVRGKPLLFPMRESDGRLFLGQKVEEGAEEEKVDISVYRKLSDWVPLLLETRLTLAVSGKSRELSLAKALPDGFEPRTVESKLPLRFESDGRLRVQARPGVWNIEIVGHKVTAEKSITRPRPNGLWKEGDEVWVFQAAPQLRTVNITGAPTIDPAQTLIPAEWKALPTYALAPGAALTLVEQQRGNADPESEHLTLTRSLWLDESGQGFSAHDVVTGRFTRSWRLEANPDTRLGRLAVNSREQFITRRGSSGAEGVEIRTGNATIDADSRMERRGLDLPATSFAHDFDELSATVNLPVGWNLLHASGADRVTGSWVEAWSLGQVFLLMIIVLAVARLYGWRLGVLALVTLGITLADARAPALVWLLVITGETLLRTAKTAPLLTGARVIRAAAWLVLLLTTLPFVADELRFAFNPASMLDHERVDLVPSFFKTLGKDHDFLTSDRRFVAFAGKPAEESPDESELGRGMGGAGTDLAGLVGGEIGAGNGKAAHHRAKGRQDKVFALKNVDLGSSSSTAQSRYALNVAEYDPSIVVQTGEGLPRQAWKSAQFSFNGPVKSDRRLHLYLMPPWLGRLMASVQVGLVLILAWLLGRRPLRLRGNLLQPRSLFAGLTVLALLLPWSASAADFPPKEILDELKERLLEKPECAPDCAAISDMTLEVTPSRIHIGLQVSAAAPTAIALPGDSSSWSPTEVRVNGKPAAALERSSTGQLWLALELGVFTVDIAGPVPGRDSLQIPLPMRPRHAVCKARGFEVRGIHEDGAVDESLSLTRIASAEEGKPEFSESAPTLPPFLRVERTLILGLKWEVETKVTRETSSDAPLVLDIPLLPGESVTTANIRTARGSVSLSLGPGEQTATWSSTLAEAQTLHLRADPKTASRWSEIWRAAISPIWHAVFSGIPPVRPDPAAARTPEWRPWPGEEVHITVDKPSGAPGQTLTIDGSELAVLPDLHTTRMALTLDLRSSRSTEHAIVLPAGAEASAVTRDGASQSIRQEGRQLILSIPPGKHNVSVNWRQPSGIGLLFRAPAVDLGAPSTNSTVAIKLREKARWVLWLDGPSVGPAVGFWPMLLFLLIVSVALARARLTPLRTHHWLLLGMGLVHIEPVPALLVLTCLLGLGWRSRKPSSDRRPALHNLGQLAFAILIIGTVFGLVVAVDTGLVRTPDMFITGNNSTANHLAWFQGRASQVLAQPLLVSLPIWAYRISVIAWALWLVVATLRWSPWVWSCFKQHGLWRSMRKPITIPPPSP